MTDFISDEMVEAAAGVLFSTNILQCGGIDEQNNIVRAALVAAMRAAWRPPIEKPDEGQQALIALFDCQVIAEAVCDDGNWRVQRFQFRLDCPWMPFPPPPAKEGV